MKLIEAIKELDKKQKIKIGAKDGVAFFYCGTAGDFVKKAEAYNRELNASFVTSLNRAEDNWKATIERQPTYTSFCKMEMENEKPEFTSAQYARFVNEWFKEVQAVYKSKTRSKERLESYIELKERVVTDVFNADPVADEEKPKVIMVEGYETGKYWIMSEANGRQGISTIVLEM